MNQAASLSSRIFGNGHRLRRVSALAASLGAPLVLLGAACGSSEDFPAGTDAPPAAGSAERPPQSTEPTPAAPPADVAPAGTEAVAGDAPLDESSAAAPPSAGGSQDAMGDAGAPSPAPEEGAPDAGAAPGTPDPTLDENLAFILEDGFQTNWFVSECRSLGEDGSIIEPAEGGTLPVGGGFILECRLEQFPSRATTDVLSTLDERWCALGELFSYQPGGDDRLSIDIVTPPDVSPAVLIARREGEPIELAQAAAFGALVWPLWIESSYDVNQVTPAEPGRVCDETFGL